MTHVQRTLLCPAPVAVVQKRWYDTSGWPAWVDGLAAVVQRDDRWPLAAGQLEWQSTPYGRGRVSEVVSEHVEGVGQETWISDGQLQGRQRVRFGARGPDTEVTLELEYSLRRRRPWTFLVDLLFIRRAVGDSLGRTLDAFARGL